MRTVKGRIHEQIGDARCNERVLNVGQNGDDEDDPLVSASCSHSFQQGKVIKCRVCATNRLVFCWIGRLLRYFNHTELKYFTFLMKFFFIKC